MKLFPIVGVPKQCYRSLWILPFGIHARPIPVRHDRTLGVIKHPPYSPGGTTNVLALAVARRPRFGCQPSRASRASPVRRGRASTAKQGERQEYTDLFSLHRQSLQNKQCFHNQYMHTCLQRATLLCQPVSDKISRPCLI